MKSVGESMKSSALAVSVIGLAQLVERRGKGFAITELVQNAWDADDTKEVRVYLTVQGKGRAELRITDDSPDGFKDLSHAYTLYAPSAKKGQAEKRGRFNLGEKLVVALSDTFVVSTTSGTITIDVKKDQRTESKVKRKSGSEILAVLRMTKEEVADAIQLFGTLIPPAGIATYLNDVPLAPRTPLVEFEAKLQSELSDAQGVLRRTERTGLVRVYEPLPGETPSIYELGIPVVETEDRFHVDVQQKVPLTTDRDNVPPAFLKRLRAFVLNETALRLSEEDARAPWVTEAIESPLVAKDAVEVVLDHRFGKERVSFDMSDREANRTAMAQGYTVVPPQSLSKAAWGIAKGFGLVTPAGQVVPSPDAKKSKKEIPQEDWTPEQRQFALAVQRLHVFLVKSDIGVVLVNDPAWGFHGTYGGEQVTFNMATRPATVGDKRTLSTILHEFAHSRGGHLTHDFDDAIASFAAELVALAITDPKKLKSLLGIA
jgi:hypothetical protein